MSCVRCTDVPSGAHAEREIRVFSCPLSSRRLLLRGGISHPGAGLVDSRWSSRPLSCALNSCVDMVRRAWPPGRQFMVHRFSQSRNPVLSVVASHYPISSTGRIMPCGLIDMHTPPPFNSLHNVGATSVLDGISIPQGSTSH